MNTTDNDTQNVSSKKRSSTIIRKILLAKELGIAATVVVVIIILSFGSPYFLTIDNLAVVSRQIALSTIIAIGMTLVIILGGIDLSVGSVVAITSVMIGVVLVYFNLPIWLAILIGILIGALVGYINGMLIVNTGVSPIIVTLGMMGLARGAALIITKGSTISGLPESYLAIGQGFIGIIPIPVIIMVIILIIFYVVLTRTTFGRHIFFIGSNESAAKLSGIQVNKTKVLVYVICSLLAATEAVIETARMSTSQPASGAGYELIAIGAVIIGGTSIVGGQGTLIGTLLGATLLSLITNGLILMRVSAYWQQVFSGGIIILAVAIDTWRRRRLN